MPPDVVRGTAPQVGARAENKILDVFMVNDEVEMMSYRLKLHASITIRTLVVESRYTFTGKPKPLLARAALSAAEIKRHDVRLLELNPDPRSYKHLLRVIERDARNSTVDAARAKARHKHTGGTLDAAYFAMEHIQRERLSFMLRDEVEELRRSHGSDFLVHVSHADRLTQRPRLTQCLRFTHLCIFTVHMQSPLIAALYYR